MRRMIHIPKIWVYILLFWEEVSQVSSSLINTHTGESQRQFAQGERFGSQAVSPTIFLLAIMLGIGLQVPLPKPTSCWAWNLNLPFCGIWLLGHGPPTGFRTQMKLFQTANDSCQTSWSCTMVTLWSIRSVRQLIVLRYQEFFLLLFQPRRSLG